MFGRTSLMQYLFTIFCCFSCIRHVSSLSSVQHQPHQSATTALSDRLTLLSFKSVISDAPTGSLASWNDSLHYCRWRGVTCGRRHPGRVVALDLTSLQLAGPVSPVLGNLTFLRRLNLSDNALHGSMPPEIGRLFRLRHLNLSINSLGGRIPATLSRCSRLKTIDLRDNKLQGEIPGDLGNCLDLRIISFFDNQLSGGIPPSFGNLSSLTYLSLGRNTLSGGIPPSLGKLPSLTVLDLVFNNLTGGIPPSLWNLSSVVVFGLQRNQLNASLPPYLGQALPRLRRFYMSKVLLHGSIPMSLANASDLQIVELGGNALTGRVPPNLGSLRNLNMFDLYGNQLEAVDPDGWSFITGLTNCTNLQMLELGSNNLGGVLPNSIVNLSTSVWFLTLQRNHISGSLPPELGKLVGLSFLVMGSNLLTGPIPPSFGKLQLLERVDLNSNTLSGEIPSTIGNLTHLEELYLDVNELSGGIPASLGLCQNLALIDLRFNKLNGTIPKEIFSIYTLSIGLWLAYNSLAGPLPSEVGNLKNLEELDISENNISGEIPSSLGECLALNFIRIGGNFFHGTIPPSLRNITAIQQLNLSHNQLSGHIPDFLKDFRSLYYLNLSFNNFEGEVPTSGVFENMSAISVQGNNNLCGGNAQLQLPPCPNQAPTKKHSTPGLPVIIAVTGAVLCLLLFLILGFCYVKRKSTKNSSGTTALFKEQHNVKRKSTKNSSGTTALFKEQHMKVSYAELVQSTEGFSPASLIGVGSFGCVYRGTLDGKVVAVKVLNLQQTGAVKSFMAECEVLKNVRHRNLVKIITACSSVDFSGNNFKAMVFEFMNNGSLESWLHSEDEDQPRSKKLNLRQRLSIAIDVASALDYLHNHGQRPIIHCDLKPSNILLDDDMTAHVGDFGLARFLKQTTSKSSQNSTNSAGLKGTIGYVAPEYGVANRVSTQGDVYSFGILVLEMFTGKRPTDHAFKEGLSLRDYVKAALPNGVMDAVDEYMLLEEEEVGIGVESTLECVASMLRIGLLCSNELPMDRMEMGAAVKELHAIRDVFLRAGM